LRAEGHLWPKRSGANVWAVVDGACDHHIHRLLMDSCRSHCCLYGGDPPQVLAEVSPYQVQIYRNDRLTWRMIEEGCVDAPRLE
jgi:hypothetical protein